MATVNRLHQENAAGKAKVTYSFAQDGGAVGFIDLPLVLPQGSLVTLSIVDVDIAPTSGGSATIALGFNTATDILAATAIASITGRVACVPVGTAATAVKLTAERRLRMTIGTAALTAGRFNILVEYFDAA